MAEAILPTYDQMMQPTMDALQALGGTATNQAIHDYVVQQLDLREPILELSHGDKGHLTEVEYRLHWTRTYLKRFGLIDNPARGHWCLTADGQNCRALDPALIIASVKQQMRAEQQMRVANLLVNTADNSDLILPVEPHPENENPDGSNEQIRSPTPNLPTYSNARHFLRILDGVHYVDYRNMYNGIWEQRGNPQEQVDWADPDAWIAERLSGQQQTLAERIWCESQKALNPRYLRGCWYLATKYGLLDRDAEGILCCTERGQQFITADAGGVVQEIDSYEGIVIILRLVAEKGPGRRSEFLPAYGAYCRGSTTFKSDNVIKGSLYDRLLNLTARSYVLRRGQSYEVTDAGLAYLDKPAALAPGHPKVSEKQSDILKLAKAMKEEARRQLQDYLSEMNPFKFEELIKLLLEEMGYQNVLTTSPTNDKGVDVVGDIELGISSVREVIQAKRHRGSINRTVLDQLRGSLHRFNAVRGTIITTGRFSKGAKEAAFERGVAPITLIDGEKLLDLLINNQIGVTKKSVEYFEFAMDKLTQFELEQVAN